MLHIGLCWAQALKSRWCFRSTPEPPKTTTQSLLLKIQALTPYIKHTRASCWLHPLAHGTAIVSQYLTGKEIFIFPSKDRRQLEVSDVRDPPTLSSSLLLAIADGPWLRGRPLVPMENQQSLGGKTAKMATKEWWWVIWMPTLWQGGGRGLHRSSHGPCALPTPCASTSPAEGCCGGAGLCVERC